MKIFRSAWSLSGNHLWLIVDREMADTISTYRSHPVPSIEQEGYAIPIGWFPNKPNDEGNYVDESGFTYDHLNLTEEQIEQYKYEAWLWR